MKLLYLTLVLLVLSACTSSRKKNDISLAGKVYSFAPELDTSNCTVSGGCDCCSSDLIFQEDGHFIMIDYCVSDETILAGSYEAKNDSVFLNFTQTVVDKLNNWESEDPSNMDSVMNTYTIQPRQIPSNSLHLATFQCNGQTGIKSAEGGIGYGLLNSSLSADQLRKKLADDGIWDKLELK